MNLFNHLSLGLLQKNQHPRQPLLIWNYSRKVQYEGLWDDITLSARGLVTDLSGNRIIAQPFSKFFNYEELDVIPSNYQRVLVQEKFDGSLGILFFHNEWIMATRGSFSSDQAREGLRILNNKYDLSKFDRNYTYLVEILYPENRIVVNYGYESIKFLSATRDGIELLWNDCNHLFNKCGISQDDIVPTLEFETFDHEMFLKLKNLNLTNKEGFVVKFEPSNFRFKIKFSEYNRLHRILTNLTSVDVWEGLVNQNLNSILDNVPDEFDNWVRSTSSNILEKFNGLYSSMIALYEENKLKNRKDYALWVKTQDPKYSPILFHLYDGKDITKIVWDRVKPERQKSFQDIQNAD